LLTTLVVGGGLLLAYNRILLVGLNESLARSRGLSAWWTQMLFSAAVVMVVIMNLSWVGLLIVNSLLIVPAAAARNVAKNTRQYVLYAVGIAVFSGVAGLIVSYYSNTATGASVVLVAIGCFVMTLGVKVARSISSGGKMDRKLAESRF